MALRSGDWGFSCCYGFVAGGVAGGRGAFHFLDERDEASEALFAGGFVCGRGVGSFAGAHEAVASSVVGDGFEFFACGFHGLGSGREGGADAGVVAGVEAVDGGGDGGDVRGSGAVEDEGGGEVFAVRGEGEGFSATPAETDGGDRSVTGGDFFSVVGGGVEVGGDDGGIEARDGFGGGVHAGEGVGVAVVWAEAGEEIGRDDDEALAGELVSHLFSPVAEAEDFMDENDDGSFGFDFGIDDEGLNGATAVLEVDVLMVAGRGVEAGFGPVLRVNGGGGERQEKGGGEEFEGAGRSSLRHGFRHGEESSTWRAGGQDGAVDFCIAYEGGGASILRVWGSFSCEQRGRRMRWGFLR